MVLSRAGYTISLILILIIIGAASGAFYMINKDSESTYLSPEEMDGLHLECVNICGIVAGQQVCYPRCQYIFGESPDQCDPIGSVCLMP